MESSNQEILTSLEQGKITIQGEFLWGSNYTFLVQITYADQSISAVYKPVRGERPLWDFPTASLAGREVAAYLVSEALNWNLVPPTVYRRKGPVGAGSLQAFIEHDPEYHYFNFSEEDRQRLRPVALFDLLINNADRKGSHVLIGPDDRLWLIDHGVCFHVEEKIRTVIWDFAGEPLPLELCESLTRLRDNLLAVPEDGESHPSLAQSLRPYLSLAEIQALARRAQTIVARGHFPPPNPYRRPYPWPQI